MAAMAAAIVGWIFTMTENRRRPGGPRRRTRESARTTIPPLVEFATG
jgi:hypothetical protein